MMHSDVIDVADWEQTQVKAHPSTDLLHWHRQDPEWTCGGRGGLGDLNGYVRCDGHGAERGSLFCALAYFFEHFAHDALLKEFPSPKEPIGTPESLRALQKIPSSELTPANLLRWFTILIGDLHQPLHWLQDHKYGEEVIVRYNGEEHSLLSFWEDYLPKHMRHSSAPSSREYAARSQSWQNKVPTELFREWAKEVAEMLCTQVYAPMTVNHADGTRVESPFVLDDQLFNKWVKLAEELMSVAGERLAFVLNEIIEHKRHKEAQREGRGLPSRKTAVGTEVKPIGTASSPATGTGSTAKAGFSATVPTTHSAKATDFGHATQAVDTDFSPEALYKQLIIADRRRRRGDAAVNAAIAVVLVPSLLFAYNWHARLGGGGPMRLVKHLKM